MNEIMEKFEKLHIDVVNTMFNEDVPDGYIHPELYYIAKSIDMIGKVDAVYFARGWQLNRGCRVERQVAQDYGVKILHSDFLEDDKETVKRKLNLHMDDSEQDTKWFNQVKQIERRLIENESV